MQPSLGEQLAKNWPQVMEAAKKAVEEEYIQAEIVHKTPPGANRQLEMHTLNLAMGHAAGVLAVLRTLRPGDPTLENLAALHRHCPVIVLTGPEPKQETRPVQLRLVEGGSQ